MPFKTMPEPPTIPLWQQFLEDPPTWILFRRGTCVALPEPGEDPIRQAVAVLRRWGLLRPAALVGRPVVTPLADYPGWLVTGPQCHLHNYVGPEAVEPGASPLIVGLVGLLWRE
jgi:hypothetical protein